MKGGNKIKEAASVTTLTPPPPWRGALAGIVYEIEGIPKKWFAALGGKETINAACSENLLASLNQARGIRIGHAKAQVQTS